MEGCQNQGLFRREVAPGSKRGRGVHNSPFVLTARFELPMLDPAPQLVPV